MLRLVIALSLLAAVGCGSERELSGVWRQVGCGDGGPIEGCGDYVYELHIGRYGDDVAGLVVRYFNDPTGFGTFQRPRECGCYFIESGRATDESLYFRLFDTGTPRYPQPDTADGDLVCNTPNLLTTCDGRRFELEGDTDLLTGVTGCGGTGEQVVEFERVVGQPRTECYTRTGSEP